MIRFSGIAGSVAEIETQLLLASDLGFAGAEEVEELLELSDEVGKMLRGLIRSKSIHLAQLSVSVNYATPPNFASPRYVRPRKPRPPARARHQPPHDAVVCAAVLLRRLLGCIVYLAWPQQRRIDMARSQSAKQLVDLFFLGQYMLVSLLAPSFAAGAITGEKERQSYEMLLASPFGRGRSCWASCSRRWRTWRF